MRLIVFFLGLSMFSAALWAQTEAYTYKSEKRYNIIHELDGEVFIPAAYQFRQEEIKQIKAGAMKIQLYGSKVLIEGVEELGNGSFHILSKSPNRVGYVYELMDADGQPARLKVVTNKEKFVDLLYFFSKRLDEHTFFLAEKNDIELATERSHFTAKKQYFVRNYGNLISKTVIPFQYVTPAMDTPKDIAVTEGIQFLFNKTSVETPLGSFEVKKQTTVPQRLKGYPAVRSMIEIWFKSKKGQAKKMLVYVNFKQQIEVIQLADKRYLLMP